MTTINTIQETLAEAKRLSANQQNKEAEILISPLLEEPLVADSPKLHFAVLTDLSDYLQSQGRVKEALTCSLRALELVSTDFTDEGAQKRASTNTNLGNINRYLSNYQNALDNYTEAKNIYETLQDKKGIAASIGNIGIIYSSTSDFKNAKEHFEIALNLCKELKFHTGVLKNLGNLGIVSFYLSDYTASVDYMMEALEISYQLKQNQSIASCIGNLGNIFMALADYHRALDYSMRGLELEIQAGDQLGIAMNSGNIGNIYLHLEDYPKALEYYNKSIELYQALGNKSGAATNIGNVGKVHLKLEDYAKTLDYFLEALKLNIELGERLGAAKNNGDIGLVYLKLEDFEQAKLYLERSLKLAEELGESSCKLNAMVYLGELYLQKKYEHYNIEQAFQILTKALEESRNQGLKELAWRCSKKLCEIYQIQDNWPQAFKMLVQQQEIEKEMNKDAADKMTKDIENKRQIEEAEKDRQVKLARFKEQEKILHNILPAQIADRMLDGEKQIADYCEGVSVFFSDIVGFTKLSQNISAQELVSMLNGLFSEFDQIARKYGLEKIKTIGDAYMAAAGIPTSQPDHAERTANFALEVVEFMKTFKTDHDFPLQIRIGLHSGNAVAGIIGENKFAYDIWGDAVNTASRMESHGEAGKIHLSADFKHALPQQSFIFQEREEIEIKGKGKMKTYFLVDKKN